MKRLILLALVCAASCFGQSQHGITIPWTWTQGNGGPCSGGFDIYRSTVSLGPYTQVGSVASCLTFSYSDPASGLSSGTTYYYVVTTLGAGGLMSGYSNQASVTFQLLPNSPVLLPLISQ